MKLTGKIILITGASSGIGYELAKQLAPCNRLVLIARRKEMLETLVASVPAPLAPHSVFQCDVGDPEQVRKVCEQLNRAQIPVEVAILNAGLSRKFKYNNLLLEDITTIFSVNFFGVVHFIEQLLPQMLRQNRGIIAATGSLAGYRGMPAAAPYSASKAALATFLESLRIDLVKTGIQVSLISPGFVRTPMISQNRFTMPFVLPVEKAAKIIIRGLEKEKTEIHFPYALSLPAKFAKLFPNRFYAWLMHGRH
jgi:short-subunit dehydrogenase